MKKIDIASLEKLKSVVKEIIPQFSQRQIVLLDGPLGCGKTQTVRYIVDELGGGDICSPSFAIHNIYTVSGKEIDHIDLYRLQDEDDIESTGFWDLFEKEQGLILIEWASYLKPDQIPLYWDQLHINFEFNGDKSRSLTITR